MLSKLKWFFVIHRRFLILDMKITVYISFFFFLGKKDIKTLPAYKLWPQTLSLFTIHHDNDPVFCSNRERSHLANLSFTTEKQERRDGSLQERKRNRQKNTTSLRGCQGALTVYLHFHPLSQKMTTRTKKMKNYLIRKSLLLPGNSTLNTWIWFLLLCM